MSPFVPVPYVLSVKKSWQPLRVRLVILTLDFVLKGIPKSKYRDLIILYKMSIKTLWGQCKAAYIFSKIFRHKRTQTNTKYYILSNFWPQKESGRRGYFQHVSKATSVLKFSLNILGENLRGEFVIWSYVGWHRIRHPWSERLGRQNSWVRPTGGAGRRRHVSVRRRDKYVIVDRSYNTWGSENLCTQMLPNSVITLSVSGTGTGTRTSTMGTIDVGSCPFLGVVWNVRHKTIEPIHPCLGPSSGDSQCN